MGLSGSEAAIAAHSPQPAARSRLPAARSAPDTVSGGGGRPEGTEAAAEGGSRRGGAEKGRREPRGPAPPEPALCGGLRGPARAGPGCAQQGGRGRAPPRCGYVRPGPRRGEAAAGPGRGWPQRAGRALRGDRGLLAPAAVTSGRAVNRADPKCRIPSACPGPARPAGRALDALRSREPSHKAMLDCCSPGLGFFVFRVAASSPREPDN